MSNKELMIDYYELTMANSYFEKNMLDQKVYFDYFFRSIPDNAGYAIFAGLESLLEFLENFKFSNEDIEFLKSKNTFSNAFLDYLKTFKFSGKIYSFKEGSFVFPNEPIVTVYGNIIECQLIETFLLLSLNHQSLVATKASRIINVSNGKAVMEFGARRAHGYSAALYGARSAYIVGAIGTSLTLADKKFKIPSLGTMAHSYVQMFDSEYEAFKAYADTYPNNISLLIDTYDTLKSGIKNCIKLYNEHLKDKNLTISSIRIDSGDIAYLTKKVRKILDENGLKNTKIIISNSLDEHIINDLLVNQKAPIDIFGVGERLITSKSSPVYDGVYKLVAVEKSKKIVPKIKVSNTIVKITTPGFKQVYRLYNSDNMAICDLITLRDEKVNTDSYVIFDPLEPWKKQTIKNFTKKAMLELVYDNGRKVEKKSLEDIKNHYNFETKTFWDEVKRLENPHTYYVDLSQQLYDLKKEMIKEFT